MNQVKTVTTNKCYERKHPEFRLVVDPAVPQVDVDALVLFLEQEVQQGVRFKDGEIIDFGSMCFRVATVEDFLTLEEPDLLEFPISWKLGITAAMKLMRLQKDIAESVGLGDELDFASIRNSLLVGTDLAEGPHTLILDRAVPDGSDSGWFIGTLDSQRDYNDAANLCRISVYEAILNWPCITGFLALPRGCRVETSPLQISRDGNPIEITKGSFLDIVSLRGFMGAI